MVLLQGTSKQTYRGAAVAVSAAAVLGILGLQGTGADSLSTSSAKAQPISATLVAAQAHPAVPLGTAQEEALERACLSGLVQPIGQQVSFDARLRACTQRIENASGRDRVLKVLDRARLLHFNGSTNSHKNQAYLDFSLAIAFGIKQPSIYAARGKLNHTLRRDPKSAIADYDIAIKLANGAALPAYYLERAKCKVALADQQEDPLILGSALQDVDTYLEAFPESEGASKMRGWLVSKVEPLLEEFMHRSG